MAIRPYGRQEKNPFIARVSSLIFVLTSLAVAIHGKRM
jgi:hypothetical protein